MGDKYLFKKTFIQRLFSEKMNIFMCFLFVDSEKFFSIRIGKSVRISKHHRVHCSPVYFIMILTIIIIIFDYYPRKMRLYTRSRHERDGGTRWLSLWNRFLKDVLQYPLRWREPCNIEIFFAKYLLIQRGLTLKRKEFRFFKFRNQFRESKISIFLISK